MQIKKKMKRERENTMLSEMLIMILNVVESDLLFAIDLRNSRCNFCATEAVSPNRFPIRICCDAAVALADSASLTRCVA